MDVWVLQSLPTEQLKPSQESEVVINWVAALLLDNLSNKVVFVIEWEDKAIKRSGQYWLPMWSIEPWDLSSEFAISREVDEETGRKIPAQNFSLKWTVHINSSLAHRWKRFPVRWSIQVFELKDATEIQTTVESAEIAGNKQLSWSELRRYILEHYHLLRPFLLECIYVAITGNDITIENQLAIDWKYTPKQFKTIKDLLLAELNKQWKGS